MTVSAAFAGHLRHSLRRASAAGEFLSSKYQRRNCASRLPLLNAIAALSADQRNRQHQKNAHVDVIDLVRAVERRVQPERRTRPPFRRRLERDRRSAISPNCRRRTREPTRPPHTPRGRKVIEVIETILSSV